MEICQPNKIAWTKVEETQLKQISCDGRLMAGVTDDDDVYVSSDYDTTFHQIPGKLVQLVVHGGAIFGVNSIDNILFGYSHDDPQWVNLPGKLINISYDGAQLAGCNRANNVFTAECNLMNTPNFHCIPGRLSQVWVYGGVLYGVDPEGQVFVGNSIGAPDWKTLPGKMKQVSFDGKRLYGVDPEDQIYFADKDLKFNPNWTKLNGNLKWVEGLDGTLVGVNALNHIYTANIDK